MSDDLIPDSKQIIQECELNMEAASLKLAPSSISGVMAREALDFLDLARERLEFLFIVEPRPVRLTAEKYRLIERLKFLYYSVYRRMSDWTPIKRLMGLQSPFPNLATPGLTIANLERSRAYLTTAATLAQNRKWDLARRAHRLAPIEPDEPSALTAFRYYYVACFVNAINMRAPKYILKEAFTLYKALPAVRPAPPRTQKTESSKDQLIVKLTRQIRSRLPIVFQAKGEMELYRALLKNDEPDGKSDDKSDDKLSLNRKAAAIAILLKRSLARDQIAPSQELYQRLAAFGQSPLILLIRSKAAIALMEALLKRQEPAAAKEIYEDMAKWAEPINSLPGQAFAAIALAKDWINKGDLAEVKKLYQDLAERFASLDFKDSTEDSEAKEPVIIALGTLAALRLEETLNQGLIEEALTFHATLSALGPSLAAREIRAKITGLLVAELARGRHLSEAARLLESIPLSADSLVIMKAKNLAKAILTHYDPAFGEKGYRRWTFPPGKKLDTTWSLGVTSWRNRIFQAFKLSFF
ncbi:MAG: hypothetical protein LBS60_15210 [Deltaproteobacteria bacterium]|jgi:hypothetical protein|nr:hypothetical protein [Deltaproteobacteria bacterium]